MTNEASPPNLLFTMKILWCGFFFSFFIYGFVVYNSYGTMRFDLDYYLEDIFAQIMAGAGFVVLVLSSIVPNFMLPYLLIPSVFMVLAYPSENKVRQAFEPS